MNICEHTILEILKDKIKIMDEIVPVIVSKRFKDTTPSISLDTTSTNPVSERYSYNCLLPLNLNHPLYDKDNPNKLYAQEVIISEENLNLRIHIWTNNEKQRQLIKEQIKLELNKALCFHYTYCTNYNNDTLICETLNRECEVLNNISSLSIKGQCPNPKKYKYQSIFKKNHIKNGSVRIYGEYDQDSYDLNPVILQTILKMKMTYYSIYNKGGYEASEIKIE